MRPDGTGYRQLTEGATGTGRGSGRRAADWIVFQTTRGDSSLAALRPDGGGWQALPVGTGLSTPRWSPDGAAICAFHNDQGGVLCRRDGRASAAAVRRVLPPVADGVLFWPIAWSPDGALLAGRATRAGQIEDIVVRSMASGEYRTLPRQTSGAREDFNMVFVDRRHLVYTDDRALWIRDVLGGEPKRLYSPPGGRADRQPGGVARRPLADLDRARRRIRHLADDARRGRVPNRR